MKKIYLFATTFALTAGVFAQTTQKIALTKAVKTQMSAAKSGNSNGGNSTLQLTGGIICGTGYVAGATMNLDFTINLTNADAEYADFLSVTFPAGITPNSSPTTSFPTLDNGGGVETLNPISGQTVSWGVDNNDQYGGISTGGALNFTVNVTIAAGTTGTQTATFFASGDGYGAAPGDLSGTIAINPQAQLDVAAVGVILPQNPEDQACGLTSDNPVLVIKNIGATTINSGQTVMYSVNGGTAVSQTGTFLNSSMQPVASIATYDTAYIAFTTPVDLSAVGGYQIRAWINTTADTILVNDTATATIVHLPFIKPTQASEFFLNVDSLGTSTDPFYLAGWIIRNVAGDASWGISTASAYLNTGACFRINETVVGASEDWTVSTCLDLTAGDAYELSFVQRMTSGRAGTLGAYLGTSKETADFFGTIIAQDTVTPNSTYALNKGSFSVATSGTYYIGFKAENTDAAARMDLRMDNIRITAITNGAAGIKNVSNAAALSVFPNPSNGNVTIELANNSDVVVYNVLGSAVYTNKHTAGVSNISLNNLSNGVYYVKAITNGETSVKQIVINK